MHFVLHIEVYLLIITLHNQHLYLLHSKLNIEHTVEYKHVFDLICCR